MKKRRFLRVALILPIVLTLLLVLWGLLDAREGASAVTIWNYTWPGPKGGTVGGYLSAPETARRAVANGSVPVESASRSYRGRPSADGRYPAVLLLHEWWGLNIEMTRMAEALAANGYIVLAPDLLRGNLSVTVPGAFFNTLTVPSARVATDADLAFRQLAGIPEVDPQRVGVVGFGFGGNVAMRMGARNSEIAAVGIFYANDFITEPSEVGYLGSIVPVYGAYGTENRSVPQDDIAAFRGLLSSRGASVEINVFDGVGGAFVNPQRLRTDPIAQRAWNELRTFLAVHL